MKEWNDYIMEGTDNVLKNKFNITSQEELDKKETEEVVLKLSRLYLKGITGNLDEKHLCDIHRYLFENIYEFAGTYREVDMRKITHFTKFEDIPTRIKDFFSKRNKIEVNLNSKFDIARYIADYYYELIEIHPFREGNGRAIREFIRQLVLYKFPMYELDYTKINKENFQIGVIGHSHYPLLLAYEIYNALVVNEINDANEFSKGK